MLLAHLVTIVLMETLPTELVLLTPRANLSILVLIVPVMQDGPETESRAPMLMSVLLIPTTVA